MLFEIYLAMRDISLEAYEEMMLKEKKKLLEAERIAVIERLKHEEEVLTLKLNLLKVSKYNELC